MIIVRTQNQSHSKYGGSFLDTNQNRGNQIRKSIQDESKNKKPSKSLHNRNVAEGSSKATKTTNNPQDKRSKTVNLPRNLRDEVRKYQEE